VGGIDNLQPIHRGLALAGLTSTMPQQKAQGKGKGWTLTCTEIAERNSRKKRLRPKYVREHRLALAVAMQVCIHIRPIHVTGSTAVLRC